MSDMLKSFVKKELEEQIKNKYDQEFIFPPIHIKEFMKELKLQIIS